MKKSGIWDQMEISTIEFKPLLSFQDSLSPPEPRRPELHFVPSSRAMPIHQPLRLDVNQNATKFLIAPIETMLGGKDTNRHPEATTALVLSIRRLANLIIRERMQWLRIKSNDGSTTSP